MEDKWRNRVFQKKDIQEQDKKDLSEKKIFYSHELTSCFHGSFHKPSTKNF